MESETLGNTFEMKSHLNEMNKKQNIVKLK